MNNQLAPAAKAEGAKSEWRANWPLVGASMAGMSLASVSISSIGIIIAPIEKDIGWSRAEITSGPAMVSFVTVCLAPFMGAVIDRVGARRVAICSAALLCAALAMMSLSTSSLSLWWSLWILVGLASSTMPTVWTTPITNLFTAARGLALAIALSGTGIGASLVPLIAGYCVEHYGWRSSYLTLGILWALLSLPLIFMFFRDTRPRSVSVQSINTSSIDVVPNIKPGLTVREGFRSKAFYLIAIAGFGTALFGTALVINLVPILSSTGMAAHTAAIIAGVTGAFTLIGRIVGGYLMDRIGAQKIAAGAAIAATALPLAIILMPGSVTAAIVGVVIFGFSAGPKLGAIVYLAGRHLGLKSFGTLVGTINAVLSIGVGSGPLLANVIYDHTHSYQLVLWGLIPALVVIAILFLLLGPYPNFESNEAKVDSAS